MIKGEKGEKYWKKGMGAFFWEQFGVESQKINDLLLLVYEFVYRFITFLLHHANFIKIHHFT